MPTSTGTSNSDTSIGGTPSSRVVTSPIPIPASDPPPLPPSGGGTSRSVRRIGPSEDDLFPLVPADMVNRCLQTSPIIKSPQFMPSRTTDVRTALVTSPTRTSKLPTPKSSDHHSLFSGLGIKNPLSSFTKPPSSSLLPPIPPQEKGPTPSKPARTSLTLGSKSSRLKSPSRRGHQAPPPPSVVKLTLEDFNVLTGEAVLSTKGGKGFRRYTSSLPDKDRDRVTSPVAFDINSFLCHNHNQSPIDFSSLLGPQTYGQPSKNCKNRHLWKEADHRHSSYHPVVADAAYNAAYNAALNAHMFFSNNSRPTSPLNLNLNECPAGDLSHFCSSCASKTFPRGGARNPVHHGLCVCCTDNKDPKPSSLSGFGTKSSKIGGSLLGLDYEDRLLRLESDKETLHLQVSVLGDQIEAQTDKIKDLERLLDDKRNVLENTEEQLNRELLSRSSLETQKLELLTELSSLRLRQAGLERENYELKERVHFGGHKPPLELTRVDGKPPTSSSNGGSLSLRSSSPLHHLSQIPQRNRTPPATAYRRIDPSQSTYGTMPRRHISSSSSSGGNLPLSPLPINFELQLNSNHHHREDAYHLKNNTTTTTSSTSTGKANSLSSGNLHSIINYNAEKPEWERNKSTGNIMNNTNGKTLQFSLAPNNNLDTALKPPPPPTTVVTSPSGSGGHKSRGIMRIFGKLRRSNSGGLDATDQVTPAEAAPQILPSFVRGGVRATAQPRLGWQMAMKESSPKIPPEGHMSSWDSEAVVKWLNVVGLGMYAGDLKRWVKTGQQLLSASPAELEKELGIKNPLHKKKLVLAVQSYKSVNRDEEDLAGKLDYQWVIRWLDDVGLPQYKEAFTEARVDGRVLNYLTQEDLVSLKVTSILHHASIKRGIQMLRIGKFHPECLCRRGGPTPGSGSAKVPIDEGGSGKLLPLGNNNGSNGSGDYGDSDGVSSMGSSGSLQVASWTSHRVMEWLRAIDLAEYAPNLRGSGVHGGLLIFEPRFNAELMATLLSIPPNKTLLRRHLGLQINELVGKCIVQEKRGAELALDFLPLNPTTKVKIIKKSQFPLRRKRTPTDYATEDLLCPLELCYFPYQHSDSIGQLSALDTSIESSGGGPTSCEKDKVSDI